MEIAKSPAPSEWFRNCGGWYPRLDLDELRRGIRAGFVDAQDEYGMTALALAVASQWREGVDELLRGGANTELRDHRAGETPLYIAAQAGSLPIIELLAATGADPDAPNHWGITPRMWASQKALTCFDQIPIRNTPRPPPRIQNAEHLADHFERFEIPSRSEREAMIVGQSVALYVYGPKSTEKRDDAKVRITARTGEGAAVRYAGDVETPPEQTHLVERTVEFGPEHIASVYVTKPSTSARPKKKRKS